MKRRSTPGGDSRSSKGTGWRACARPGSGGSQRAHLTMRGVRKGAPGAYCLLEWRLAIWGYMKRVTISFWRVGNGHLLKYKDNQPVLNNPFRIQAHEFKLESVSKKYMLFSRLVQLPMQNKTVG